CARRSASKRRLRSKPPIDSVTMPISTPAMTIATSSSINVKPASRGRASKAGRCTRCTPFRASDGRQVRALTIQRPVADVGCDPFAARLAVGAQAEHVDLAPYARIQVLVRLAPRIDRRLLQVGLPVRRRRLDRRALRKRDQPLIRGGVALVVEPIQVER